MNVDLNFKWTKIMNVLSQEKGSRLFSLTLQKTVAGSNFVLNDL